jgi:small subunit ribosomal protein S20
MAEEKKAVKAPTPLKRHKQDQKKNLQNRMWKSKIHTARQAFGAASDEETKKGLLSSLYALLDKAGKNGLFKKNKVARLKSRLAAK